MCMCELDSIMGKTKYTLTSTYTKHRSSSSSSSITTTIILPSTWRRTTIDFSIENWIEVCTRNAFHYTVWYGGRLALYCLSLYVKCVYLNVFHYVTYTHTNSLSFSASLSLSLYKFLCFPTNVCLSALQHRKIHLKVYTWDTRNIVEFPIYTCNQELYTTKSQKAIKQMNGYPMNQYVYELCAKGKNSFMQAQHKEHFLKVQNNRRRSSVWWLYTTNCATIKTFTAKCCVFVI